MALSQEERDSLDALAEATEETVDLANTLAHAVSAEPASYTHPDEDEVEGPQMIRLKRESEHPMLAVSVARKVGI